MARGFAGPDSDLAVGDLRVIDVRGPTDEGVVCATRTPVDRLLLLKLLKDDVGVVLRA